MSVYDTSICIAITRPSSSYEAYSSYEKESFSRMNSNMAKSIKTFPNLKLSIPQINDDSIVNTVPSKTINHFNYDGSSPSGT